MCCHPTAREPMIPDRPPRQMRPRRLSRLSRLAALACMVGVALPGAARATDAALEKLETGYEIAGWNGVGQLDVAGVGFCTAALISTRLVRDRGALPVRSTHRPEGGCGPAPLPRGAARWACGCLPRRAPQRGASLLCLFRPQDGGRRELRPRPAGTGQPDPAAGGAALRHREPRPGREPASASSPTQGDGRMRRRTRRPVRCCGGARRSW